MGLLIKLLFFVLLFVAIAHFFPNAYDSGKDWVVDKTSDVAGDKVSSTLNSVVDITYECQSNNDCAQGTCINNNCVVN